MLILAFETSAKAGSAALTEGGKLLGECYVNTGLTHSQTLMVMGEDLLRQCGKTVSDVDAVAVAAGPGSFTGVRIGVAAAKGFAWGREIPCCGVSTLEAMAMNFRGRRGILCPCMDARRGQVYNGLFSVDGMELTRLTEDRAIALKELERELLALEGPVYLMGDGAVLAYNTLNASVPGLILPAEAQQHQRASGVALLAEVKIAAGEAADPAALAPNYLRLSQAERERMEKEKNHG